MKLTFLGTSSMVPTKDRNVTALYLDLPGHGILIDCGEGTQRQMNLAGINRLNVKTLLFTHMHGDHVLGLPGMLQTIGNAEGEARMRIHGPVGTKKYVHHMLNSCVFTVKVDLSIKEHEGKKLTTVLEDETIKIQTLLMEHSTHSLAYRIELKDQLRFDMKKTEKLGLKPGPQFGKLQRTGKIEVNGKTVTLEEVTRVKKGKTLVIILDTQACEQTLEIAEGADVLVTECTYLAKEQEKATEYKHLTTRDAAHIAAASGAKKLVCTHFSQRYKTLDEFAEELKDFFHNSEIAHDLKKITI